MNNNKLLIAVAGAGKTTFLINEAIKRHGAVLITTYTKSNEFEIKNKIYRKLGYIPSNIEIESWFEFLLRQGVRPFQGVMHNSLYEERTGFVLTNKKSALYTKESGLVRQPGWLSPKSCKMPGILRFQAEVVRKLEVSEQL